MEILQLRHFCDAVKTENFSKTAASFGVPASAISQSVRRLEKELGVKLFSRTANKVEVNHNGKLFFESVTNALKQIESGVKQVRENDGRLCDNIRLCVLTNRRLVIDAIKRCKAQYPDISFSINHGQSSYEEADLIVTDRALPENQFEKTPLVVEKILLAVSDRNAVLKEQAHPTLKSFQNEPFISMSEGSSLYNLTKSLCSQAGFEPDIVIRSDDPSYIRTYTELGLGVAVVPSVSWENQFSPGVRLLDIDAAQRTTYLYFNKRKYRSSAVETFFSVLCEMGNCKH